MQFPIIVGLRRSFLLGVLLGSSHFLALATVLWPDWPWRWPLAVLVLLSLGWGYQQWRRPAIRSLRLDGDGRLQCSLGDQEFVDAELRPGVLCHPWLVVLPLRLQDRAVTVVVAPDSASVSDRRRLRIWLRWLATTGGKPSSDAP